MISLLSQLQLGATYLIQELIGESLSRTTVIAQVVTLMKRWNPTPGSLTTQVEKLALLLNLFGIISDDDKLSDHLLHSKVLSYLTGLLWSFECCKNDTRPVGLE